MVNPMLQTELKEVTKKLLLLLLLLCGNALGSLAHVLSRSSALVQNKYILMQNAALQVLFFEMLRDLGLADSVLPW